MGSNLIDLGQIDGQEPEIKQTFRKIRSKIKQYE